MPRRSRTSEIAHSWWLVGLNEYGAISDSFRDFGDENENGTEDIWWILEGRDYPRLWWEATTDDVADIKT